MSITDPLADLLTRIRNGQASGKAEIKMPSSKLKASVCRVLEKEGYIENYAIEGGSEKPELRVRLKYYKGRPVIESLSRVSRPGCRVYESKNNLPVVLGGLGVAIISTSKGVMADREARAAGHGGEVLCFVS